MTAQRGGGKGAACSNTGVTIERELCTCFSRRCFVRASCLLYKAAVEMKETRVKPHVFTMLAERIVMYLLCDLWSFGWMSKRELFCTRVCHRIICRSSRPFSHLLFRLWLHLRSSCCFGGDFV